MNRDDIIRMAREAGLEEMWDLSPRFVGRLERFANLVAAAEREACAKLCETEIKPCADVRGLAINSALYWAAESIRERGLQELNKAAEANGEEL